MSNLKVMIVTTEGCKGCRLTISNVKEAISYFKYPVELEVKDFSNLDKKWLKANNIKDFPTILLTRNDIIVYKFVGNRPPIVINHYMKLHFL